MKEIEPLSIKLPSKLSNLITYALECLETANGKEDFIINTEVYLGHDNNVEVEGEVKNSVYNGGLAGSVIYANHKFGKKIFEDLPLNIWFDHNTANKLRALNDIRIGAISSAIRRMTSKKHSGWSIDMKEEDLDKIVDFRAFRKKLISISNTLATHDL